ncbi:MAG: mechanosensitive ion channel family protein [Deltaproteobacteria bacterium]|nr:mechanosensitive ion channel family protein [Deltaproteobacteria bacterium]
MPDLSNVFYGNDIKTWLTALGIAVGLMILLRLVEQVLIVRVQRLTRKTDTVIDDAVVGSLRKTKLTYLFVVAAFLGSLVLTLPERLRSIAWQVLVVATLLQAGIWVSSGLQIWLENYRASEEDGANRTTMNALSFLVRVALWTTVLLLILDNLGVDVTALVTGLGIGGVAVALAVQNVLSDLFASLSIVLDKPFVNGDFIVVGDLAGSVEHVGIKTTRIRSISGEQLVFSNSDLLTSRIRNFGRMNERRVVFSIGVTYQTSADKLERIPSIIQDVVKAQERVRFDRSHFASYGDSALNFETVYFVESADYAQHMDILQAVNLAIFRRFEDEGIEFAYPTQTLFVETSGGD